MQSQAFHETKKKKVQKGQTVEEVLEGVCFLVGAENLCVYMRLKRGDELQVRPLSKVTHYNEHTMLCVSILVPRWCELKTLFSISKSLLGELVEGGENPYC